jgi:hypothetical protein
VEAVFSTFVGQAALVSGFVFTWEKASSHRKVDQKFLPNEKLLIVLRRQINFDGDQKASAIDCLATCEARDSFPLSCALPGVLWG